jgi:plastocyanin
MKSLKMFSRVSIMLTLFSFLLLSNSCSKSSGYTSPSNTPVTPNTPGVTQGANDIWIQSMTFGPSSKTVTVGTTITWTNMDSVGHNVVSTTNAFQSTTLGQGASYSFTFTTAGVYNYFCSIHPAMTGTITVQ